MAIGRNAAAITTAMIAISQATRRTWRSSGLCSGLTRSERAAMRPSSVRMPVATTMTLASPPVQVVPLKTRSLAWSSGTPESAQSALRPAGTDSPVRVEVSTSIVPDSIRASAEIRSPSSISSTSPGTSWTASTVTGAPVPQHSRVLRQVGLERLDRPFGLHFLDEREQGVEENDDHDRDCHRGDPGQPGQAGRRPQQQRQRMGKLAAKLTPHVVPAPPVQLVRAVHDQPPRRLPPRQPRPRRPQITQQPLDRFPGIDSPGRAVGARPGFAVRHRHARPISPRCAPPRIQRSSSYSR